MWRQRLSLDSGGASLWVGAYLNRTGRRTTQGFYVRYCSEAPLCNVRYAGRMLYMFGCQLIRPQEAFWSRGAFSCNFGENRLHLDFLFHHLAVTGFTFLSWCGGKSDTTYAKGNVQLHFSWKKICFSVIQCSHKCTQKKAILPTLSLKCEVNVLLATLDMGYPAIT